MIEVVSGILTAPGSPVRLLLQQRPPSKDYPLLWETPGGKVGGLHLHESHHTALVRELAEELAITVDEVRAFGELSPAIAQSSVWCGQVGSENYGKVFILFYRVLAWRGGPVPQEGQGWGFFSLEEFLALNLTPGTLAARAAIVESVWGRVR